MQRTCCLGSPDSQLRFWLMIVSTAIWDLPVCRSPMMSWRWPRPIGVIASNGLEAGLQRLVHRLALHDGGRLQLERAAGLGLDRAEAVDRLAERVDDAAEEVVADGDGEDLAGPLDLLALVDPAEVAEDDDADVGDVEVERDAERAVGELEQLVRHRRGQALDVGDAVTGVDDAADLFAGGRTRLVGLDEGVQRVPDLLRTDRKLRHVVFSSVSSRVTGRWLIRAGGWGASGTHGRGGPRRAGA